MKCRDCPVTAKKDDLYEVDRKYYLCKNCFISKNIKTKNIGES